MKPTNNVQLTGRNVQEIVYFNALAITDAANHDSGSPPYRDVSTIGGKKMLIAYNTTDQAITLNLLTSPISGSGALQVGQTFSLPSGQSKTITSADIRELGEPINRLGVRLKAGVAPTTGSVSVWLEGVQQ